MFISDLIEVPNPDKRTDSARAFSVSQRLPVRNLIVVNRDSNQRRGARHFSDEPSLSCSSRLVATGTAQPPGLAAFATMLRSPRVGVSGMASARTIARLISALILANIF